ncbi:MAG TPA: GntR family transcriptional regulator [Acetobacteraceae bacterium]|jgi:GntR family transcriptional regulator|nr:GntR family transcriptional regulator [Acetobacteraceae bacterium]
MTFSFARPLDRADGPLYRQAAATLRAAIAGGIVPVGTELPSEAELAKGFGISLITIRHALRELEGDGFIRKRAAKTAVVAGDAPMRPVARDLNNLGDIIAATAGAALEITDYEPRRSAEAAEAFGLPSGALVHCLRGRLTVGERVLSDLAIYFPPDIGARMRQSDFDDVVVFRSVERRLGIRLSGARITVAAEIADDALAARLGMEPGEAVLVNRMLFLDGAGMPVELTVARHRADRYRLTYELRAG